MDPKDRDNVLRSMRRRAAAGKARVQNDLAAMLATGEFGFTDEAEARRWYTLAARQGYIESKWNLATMMLDGEGGPKDVNRAMGLIEQAAREGQISACGFLRDIYEFGGRGKRPDTDLSRRWAEEYERLMAMEVSEMQEFGAPLPDL